MPLCGQARNLAPCGASKPHDDPAIPAPTSASSGRRRARARPAVARRSLPGNCSSTCNAGCCSTTARPSSIARLASTPEAILAAYRSQRAQPGFDLRAFVQQHFVPQPPIAKAYVSLRRRIAGPAHRWAVERADAAPAASSAGAARCCRCRTATWCQAAASPNSTTGIPTSRCWGWPKRAGRLVHAMTDNFAYLIDTHGFMPNGNRSYYLSRSQPPVFALMTELCEARRGPGARKYLPQMLREHAFWMDGADHLQPGQDPSARRRAGRWRVAQPLLGRSRHASRRIVARGRDHRAGSRVARRRRCTATARSRRVGLGLQFTLAAASRKPAARPTCSLSTICTTDIIPVDLNAFLHKLETTISRLSRLGGDAATAARRSSSGRGVAARRSIGSCGVLTRARTSTTTRGSNVPRRAPDRRHRGAAVHRHREHASRRRRWRAPCASGCSPLAASPPPRSVSGQQWDRPNGWAPLQWMAVQGFERHGLRQARRANSLALGEDGGRRVLPRGQEVVEKYALRETRGDRTRGGHGGEYPLQDGFGWTNGVTRRWLHEIPDHDVRVGDPAPHDRRPRVAADESLSGVRPGRFASAQCAQDLRAASLSVRSILRHRGRTKGDAAKRNPMKWSDIRTWDWTTAAAVGLLLGATGVLAEQDVRSGRAMSIGGRRPPSPIAPRSPPLNSRAHGAGRATDRAR